MNEKRNGNTNRTDKANKAGNVNRADKLNREEKVKKFLEKITIDAVIDAMVGHKWLVAKTIAIHIIGVIAWDRLSVDDQYTLIKRVNEIKLKTPGLM